MDRTEGLTHTLVTGRDCIHIQPATYRMFCVKMLVLMVIRFLLDGVRELLNERLNVETLTVPNETLFDVSTSSRWNEI